MTLLAEKSEIFAYFRHDLRKISFVGPLNGQFLPTSGTRGTTRSGKLKSPINRGGGVVPLSTTSAAIGRK